MRFTALFVLLAGVQPAFADCIADPAGSTNIACFGFDPDTGIIDPTPDGLTDSRDGLNVFVDAIDETTGGPGLAINGLTIRGTGNDVDLVGVIRVNRSATAIAGGPDLTVTITDGTIEGGNGIDVGTASGLTVVSENGTFDVSATAVRGGAGSRVEGPIFIERSYTGIDLGEDSEVVSPTVSDGFGGIAYNSLISSGGGAAVRLGANSNFSIGEGGFVEGRTSDDPNPGTGVELVSGNFFSESVVLGSGAGGVGLRITGQSGLTTIDNGFDGVLAGTDYGILVEGGDANTSVQQVVNFGDLGNVDLGGGDDTFAVRDANAFTGDSDLGAGDDRLTISNVSSLNDFGLFDGGAGFDTAEFESFDLMDLFAVRETSGVLTFEFLESGMTLPSLFFDLVNFESYDIGGAEFGDAQLRRAYGLPPAAVPAPATGAMLIAGLGVLALRRRR